MLPCWQINSRDMHITNSNDIIMVVSNIITEAFQLRTVVKHPHGIITRVDTRVIAVATIALLLVVGVPKRAVIHDVENDAAAGIPIMSRPTRAKFNWTCRHYPIQNQTSLGRLQSRVIRG